MRLHLKCLGCPIRKVDDPARDDRSTVIHPDDDSLPIAEVRHLHVASHGKRQVGGGHVVHVVRLAAGRLFPFKLCAVPGCCPNLIRFSLADLFADCGLCLNRTSWSRFRLRVVRSLSRSQADDQKADRQSMSYTSLHSVLLAYSKVPFGLRLVCTAVRRCYRPAKHVSRRKDGSGSDILVIENLRNRLGFDRDAGKYFYFRKVTHLPIRK